MNSLTLRSPRGKLIEGTLDSEAGTWTPSAGLGLVYRLRVLLDNGWERVS